MGTMATHMSPPPQNKLEGCNNVQNTLYSHFTHRSQYSDWFDKLHYIYQHFQDSEKMYQLDPEADIPVPDDNSLYPYINNDIEYRLFEDIVDSYYLDSQIKDDFHCNQDCYTHQQESTIDNHSMNLAFIHKANTNIDTLLANQIYNTMILTIKMHSHSQINTQHYYNKNYKTHTGVHMTQLQLKVTKFQKTWTLRLCNTQCISLVIQTQSKD